MRLINQGFVLGIALAVSGCSSWKKETLEVTESVSPPTTNVIDIVAIGSEQTIGSQERREEQDNFGAMGEPLFYTSSSARYQAQGLTKHIGDYARNMAQDMIANMDYVTQKTPVGVTHFALLDSDLQKTNLLGRQIAESLMHELHKFRIPVIDFKATDYIRVTPTGDFTLSRDYLELENQTAIEYVLTGTLVKHQGGYMVNARMLGTQSRAVVATAQTLIPHYVADALLPSDEVEGDNRRDGVRLVSKD